MQLRVLAITLALGSTLAACEGPTRSARDDETGGDRRVEALKGADSTASANVDAAATVNQVQIPDYPPADADQSSPAASAKAPR